MLSFHKATLLALFVLGCGGATEAPSPNVTTQAGSGNGVSDGGAATPSPSPVAALPLDTSIPAPKITVDDFSGYIDIADDRKDVELRVPTTASNLYTGPITIDHSFEMAVAGVLGPDGCGDPGGNYTTVAYQFYTIGP